ncbi:MAG: hypothetical protein ACI92I_000272 [Acidimicrobiales bacterium]|jgi:hypothetical protein
MSNPQTRIAGALFIGALLISSALFIRSWSVESVPVVHNVAVVTAAPERTAIAVTDKNNDGVPDWQEALLVTEAMNISGTTTAYTAPETLTDQFALEFFEEMVRNENYGEFGDTPEELVLQTSEALAREARDVLLEGKDITISSNNSIEALSRYGEDVAIIIDTYSTHATENEAKILERALREQSAEGLVKLNDNIAVYTSLLEETQKLAVPEVMKTEHLNLLNTYQALIADITAMQTAFEDPMYALLRLKRYQDDAAGLYASIVNMYTALLKHDAQWDEGSAVYSLIGINTDNQ